MFSNNYETPPKIKYMPFAAMDNQVLDPSWNGVKGVTGEGFPTPGEFDTFRNFTFNTVSKSVLLRGAVMRGPSGAIGPSGYMHATWWPYTAKGGVINPGVGNQRIWREKYYIPQGVLGRDASGNQFPSDRYEKSAGYDGAHGRYNQDDPITMEVSGNLILSAAKNGGGNLTCKKAVVSNCCSEGGEGIIFADSTGSLINGKIDNTTTILTRKLIGGLARTHGAAKVETFYITFSPKYPGESENPKSYHLLSSSDKSDNVGIPLFKDEYIEFGWNYNPVFCPNGPQIKINSGSQRWFLNTWRNSYTPIATRMILRAGTVSEPIKNCLYGGEKACGTISAEHVNPDFRDEVDKTKEFYGSGPDTRYVAKIKIVREDRIQRPTYNFTYHVCGQMGTDATSATLLIEKIWNPPN